MAEVTIANDTLTITIRGIRKLGTMKSELAIPLSNVRGAIVDPDLSTGWPGLGTVRDWPGTKLLGTDAYGRYLGGTFSQDGDRVFWDVADPKKAIVISLENDDYKRLIIEVDDPEQVAREIESALHAGA